MLWARDAETEAITTEGGAMDVTEKEIGDVMTGVLQRRDEELLSMSEADLEQKWYFRHEPDKSVAWNIYQFHSMMMLYAGSCRRWEEMHNGHYSVVERVRDKYMMPKIKEFEALLRERFQKSTI